MPDRTLTEWAERVAALVAAKVADARAHAGNAVNDALRSTPDGRATAGRAGRSRSVGAARSRLAELLEDLAGPSAVSLAGVLRDAREAFYREAFARAVPRIPAALLVRPDPSPTAGGVARARGLVLHGYDLRRELAGPVGDADRRLAPAVALAGSAGSTAVASADRLDAWERSARDGIAGAAMLALGDSRVALDRIAARDAIHPDHLDDSPPEVGD